MTLVFALAFCYTGLGTKSSDPYAQIPKPRWTWSYKREAEYFIANVRSDKPFRSSAKDTLNDVRLFEEIYRMFLEQRQI